ncbi:sigma-70 family RNA polymerase sigma factor [Caproiciproducens sp. CPB-2]|uniref:sigma-70 family RNA polymerase sigma factor n=1 Tax=Caproiciproducens sp. CPB-2 TaxID=3030017 RepID=UPI002E322BCF|nr:FliA/WhiG family RNA polymerase sigma factor [Caproiciproducens sp. CPB-2]
MELWTRYRQTRNTDLRNMLVVQYSYIVKCIALKTVGRYQYFNYMDDIVNEGLIALLDAVEKFDFEKKVKFETYASIKVRGAMIDYIRKQDCFPRRLKRIAKNISEAENMLNHRLGRNPTDQEIADYLQISLPDYEKMQAETCVLNMLSFEEMIYEKGVENIQVSQSGDSIHGPEQVVAEKELQAVLAKDIELLNEKEQVVISLYYKEQLKIKEISSVMGISDSRVSQIHSSALRKLKKSLAEYLNQ